MSTLLKRPRYIFIVLVALLGLALSVVGFQTVHDAEQHQLEERFEQLPVRDATGFERHPHRFGVTRFSSADLSIIGIGRMAALIAGDGVDDA